MKTLNEIDFLRKINLLLENKMVFGLTKGEEDLLSNLKKLKKEFDIAEALRKKTYKSMSPEKVKPKGSAVGSNIYNGVLDVGRDQTKNLK